MSYEYSEDGLIELATQGVLEALGWSVVSSWKKESFGEKGLLGREAKSEIVLTCYFINLLWKPVRIAEILVRALCKGPNLECFSYKIT